MALNLRRGLRDLVAGRKGGPSKDVPKTQLPPNPTLPPLPSPLGLLLDPNLQKRKRKGKEIEEGDFAPSNDSKQQKTNRERQRKTSVESREDSLGAEVHRPQHTWSLRLELDGAPIPQDASIRNFQGGHSGYIVETFKQPLLLPKDMDTYKCFKQPDLFLSLKRDLAMISDLT